MYRDLYLRLYLFVYELSEHVGDISIKNVCVCELSEHIGHVSVNVT